METGEETVVTMKLTPRDFSIFDEGVGDWTPINGIFTLYVGTSSDNLPLSIEAQRSNALVDIE